MIKEKKEVQMVETEKVVEEALFCDECGKLIAKMNNDGKYRQPVGYWEVVTGHRDWGNDSVDSIEHADLCCDDCLRKFMDKYLTDDDYESRWFNIEHDRY